MNNLIDHPVLLLLCLLAIAFVGGIIGWLIRSALFSSPRSAASAAEKPAQLSPPASRQDEDELHPLQQAESSLPGGTPDLTIQKQSRAGVTTAPSSGSGSASRDQVIQLGHDNNDHQGVELRRELSRERRNNELLQVEIKTLQLQLEDQIHEQQSAATGALKGDTGTELEEKKHQLNQVELQLAEAEARADSLATEVAELESLRPRLQEMKLQRDALEQQLGSTELQKNEIQAGMQNQVQQLKNDGESRFNSLQKAHQHLQQQHRGLLDKQRASASLPAQLEQEQQQHQALQQTHQQLKKQFDDLQVQQKSTAPLPARLESEQRQHQALQKAHQHLQQQHRLLVEKQPALNQSLTTSEQQLADLRKQHSSLQVQNRSLESLPAAVEAEKARVQSAQQQQQLLQRQCEELTQKNRLLEDLPSRLQEEKDRTAQLKQQHQETRQELQSSGLSLQRAEQLLAEQQRQLDAAQNIHQRNVVLQTENQELTNKLDDIASINRDLLATEKEIHALNNSVSADADADARQHLEATLEAARTDLDTCRRQRKALAQELKRDQNTIRDLQEKLQVQRQTSAQLDTSTANSTPIQTRTSNATAAAKPSPAKVGKKTRPRPAGKYTNLQQINGIGPKFEKLLKKNGIKSIEQLASLSEPQIKKLAQSLGPYGERFVRESWVESASVFLDELDDSRDAA